MNSADFEKKYESIQNMSDEMLEREKQKTTKEFMKAFAVFMTIAFILLFCVAVLLYLDIMKNHIINYLIISASIADIIYINAKLKGKVEYSLKLKEEIKRRKNFF